MLPQGLLGLVSNPSAPGTLSAVMKVLQQNNDDPEASANWIFTQNVEFQCLRDTEEGAAIGARVWAMLAAIVMWTALPQCLHRLS